MTGSAPKVIARIKGGLGNQLFCFAAARRMALVNNAELVIDDISGFARDRQYQRQYALNHFRITARRATSAERLEPFERYRRGVMKWLSNRKSFSERQYIEVEGLDFDERILALRVRGTIYLDGLWQSEGYFKDIAQVIREDLQIVPPMDALSHRMADEICNANAIAVHVRWFDAPGSKGAHNVSVDYYRRAIALIEGTIESPRYFLFSDDPDAARAKLALPRGLVTFVSHNRGDASGVSDLWLMSQCRHFVIANSTFSWWGAWLGRREGKIVLTPNLKLDGKTAWGFKGLIPNDWLTV